MNHEAENFENQFWKKIMKTGMTTKEDTFKLLKGVKVSWVYSKIRELRVTEPEKMSEGKGGSQPPSPQEGDFNAGRGTNSQRVFEKNFAQRAPPSGRGTKSQREIWIFYVFLGMICLYMPKMGYERELQAKILQFYVQKHII